jgi:hypothetical protein
MPTFLHSLGQKRSICPINKSVPFSVLFGPLFAQESLAAIVAFCHAQGKRVNAEGVGTLEKQSALLQAGCDLFQGYLISPPRSVAALAEWVAIRNHTPADLNLEPQKLALR